MGLYKDVAARANHLTPASNCNADLPKLDAQEIIRRNLEETFKLLDRLEDSLVRALRNKNLEKPVVESPVSYPGDHASPYQREQHETMLGLYELQQRISDLMARIDL